MSLRTHLQTIYEDHGKLTPEIVVDVARPKSHPLHNRFEWNNTLAGELWRREQAAQLIRSVKAVYAKPDSEQRLEIRAWHAIKGPDYNSYEPTEKVIADPISRALLLRDMERDWKALKARYSDFVEFIELVKEDVLAA